MGYKPGKKVYHMQFEDFPGLEVNAHGTSLGKLMHISSLNLNLNEADEEKRMEVFTFFAGQLVSWNVEHPALENPEPDGSGGFICFHCKQPEGAPMSCDVMSLMCLELDFIMRIIIGWISSIARVSFPKEMSSNSGGNGIPEEVMRMLAQHQNLSPLPTPNLS